MRKIDDQIKALLLKKQKIDYVGYVLDLIKNDTKCVDFKEVQKDIVSQIEPFLNSLTDAIEKDSDVKSPLQFEDKEIEVLKTVVKSIISRPAKSAESTVAEPQTPVRAYNEESPQKPPPEQNPSDKMNFAMNNRHLANARIQVINDEKVQIYGTVVGLDAPHVVVKTETGPTIKVPLEKVVKV